MTTETQQSRYLDYDQLKQRPTYQHIKNYLHIQKDCHFGFIVLANTILDDPQGKILRFDKEIIEMCAETDTDFNYKMPYRSLIINNYYENDNFIIICIGLHSFYDMKEFLPTEDENKLYKYFALGIDKKDNCPIWTFGFISDKEKYKGSEQSANNMDSVARRISISICNLMSDDIQKDIIEKKVSCEQNKKREKRGKYFLRDESIIRISGKIYETAKIFYDQIKSGMRVHIVRGHWRHFTADFYKQMKNKKEWIFPFVRGSIGEIIKKSYVDCEVSNDN